jgi:hypothetical protein
MVNSWAPALASSQDWLIIPPKGSQEFLPPFNDRRDVSRQLWRQPWVLKQPLRGTRAHTVKTLILRPICQPQCSGTKYYISSSAPIHSTEKFA